MLRMTLRKIKKESKVKYIGAKLYIADMETDGVYFSQYVKEELEKQREEMYCEYSGLLSVKAYENVK